jgi:hypothetical protein
MATQRTKTKDATNKASQKVKAQAVAVEKSRGGRPPLPEGERLIQRSVRMSAEQWEKIDNNGGLEWLRQVIDAQ